METLQENEIEVLETIFEEDMKELKNDLFSLAVTRSWFSVMMKYRYKTMVHAAKITKSGDTALHLAVLDGQEYIVEQLVELLVEVGGCPGFSSMENERGNTPLHLAASVGSVRMCRCIAAKYPKLLGDRNKDGETPLFLAAFHGRKDAFLCLHEMYDRQAGPSYHRRTNGDTILHCAIAGGYFNLAYHITRLYENTVADFNERGLTPLHLLASKPSAFKSSSNLGWLDRFIYHCISVDHEKDKEPLDLPPEAVEDRKDPSFPENYRTCLDFYQLLGNFVQVISCRKKSPGNRKGDLESHGQQSHLQVPNESDRQAQGHGLFPSIYNACSKFVMLVFKFMMLVFEFNKQALLAILLGYPRVKRIREEKEKHTRVLDLVDKMLDIIQDEWYLYYAVAGRNPRQSKERSEQLSGNGDLLDDPEQVGIEDSFGDSSERKDSHDTHDKNIFKGDNFKIVVTPKNIECQCHLEYEKREVSSDDFGKGETPFLVASKKGAKEFVEKVVYYIPLALSDVNSEGKNVVHLAVENRQLHVYRFLKESYLGESIFRQTDHSGNSALHLAATLGGSSRGHIQGPALQMQSEIHWFLYVKNSMYPNFFPRYNKYGQTAEEVFKKTHEELVKEGSKWLTDTSNSCSLVAALIVPVAFATSASIPSGVKKETSAQTFEERLADFCFAISSLIALFSSVISLIMFVSIFTCRHQEEDFRSRLPKKFLIALTSLLVSIIAMLVSFCSSHFFVLKENLKLEAYPLYGILCAVVTLIAIFHFPLFGDFIRSTFSRGPRLGLTGKANTH